MIALLCTFSFISPTYQFGCDKFFYTECIEIIKITPVGTLVFMKSQIIDKLIVYCVNSHLFQQNISFHMINILYPEWIEIRKKMGIGNLLFKSQINI